MRRLPALAACLVTSSLAACGAARDLGGQDAGCGTCHGFAPASGAHAQLAGGTPSATECSFCHPASVDPAGAVLAGHGRGSGACLECHGALPPADAHVAHVRGETYSGGFPCASCHPAGAVAAATHGLDGLDVSFEGAVVPGGTYAGGLCASTYCHGNFAGGSGADPFWTTTIGCASCHGAPPTSGDHSKHLGEPGVSCETCHPGYTSTSVNRATHVDGREQVVPLLEAGSDSRGAWDAATRTCAIACHGTDKDWP